MEVEIGIAILTISMGISQKAENWTTIWPKYSTTVDTESPHSDTWTYTFVAELFTIADNGTKLFTNRKMNSLSYM